ncbi:MAG: hypothetical protein V7K64_19980 [Nostoc sp.]|uniref:hypothetical protein n=1 Tax=Nostoc sp. TaxID=1180 RepID=UPI002FEF72CE
MVNLLKISTIFVKPDAVHLALFTELTISVPTLFVGFNILTSSLSFYLGNSEGLTQLWRNAILTSQYLSNNFV